MSLCSVCCSRLVRIQPPPRFHPHTNRVIDIHARMNSARTAQPNLCVWVSDSCLSTYMPHMCCWAKCANSQTHTRARRSTQTHIDTHTPTCSDPTYLYVSWAHGIPSNIHNIYARCVHDICVCPCKLGAHTHTHASAHRQRPAAPMLNCINGANAPRLCARRFTYIAANM